MEMRRHLSPEAFARALGISVKTVRRRLKAGALPADQSGGPGTLWLIDYEAYLARMSHDTVALPHVQSVEPAANVSEFKISGPPPKWMRRGSNSKSKGGYGPR
jgi:hypothetical protein